MLTSYIEDCRLLRALARVLDLPAVAATTAFTYLHRIRLGGHNVQLTCQDLVTACIYVAAKVEEVHISANQLINSARIIGHPTQQHLLQSLAPLPQNVLSAEQQESQQPRTIDDQQQQQQQQQQQDWGFAGDRMAAASRQPQQHSLPQQQQQLGQAPQQQQEPAVSLAVVGHDYYQAKDALFTAEQIVLRLMNFQLDAPQPHKYLFNFCRLLSVSQAVAAASVCLVNDVIAYTGICNTAQPAVLAAAVLQCTIESMLGSKSSSSSELQVSEANHQLKHGDVELPHAQLPNAMTGSRSNNGLQQQQQQTPEDTIDQRQQHGPSQDAFTPLVEHQRQQQWQEERGHHRNTHRHAPHDHRDQPTSRDQPTRHCSIPAAVLDGMWVSLVGLQLQQVAEVVQQLKRLLANL